MNAIALTDVQISDSGIYRIINLLNNKSYIGQAKNIKLRIKEHLRSTINDSRKDFNVPIHAAMRKYGIDNFKCYILEQCAANLLNEREQYWISYYHTYSLDPLCNGYNLTAGGKQSIRKIKLTADDVKTIWQLLRENELTYSEIASQFNVVKGTIIAINSGKVWHSVKIQYPIRNNSRTCKNNIFEDYKYNGTAVVQKTKSGDIIKVFPSAAFAAKYLGNYDYNKHIFNCCKGKRKSAYGYIWELTTISKDEWKKLFNN